MEQRARAPSFLLRNSQGRVPLCSVPIACVFSGALHHFKRDSDLFKESPYHRPHWSNAVTSRHTALYTAAEYMHVLRPILHQNVIF